MISINLNNFNLNHKKLKNLTARSAAKRSLTILLARYLEYGVLYVVKHVFIVYLKKMEFILQIINNKKRPQRNETRRIIIGSAIVLNFY